MDRVHLPAIIAWPFGWRATVASLAGAMMVSFLLFGFFYAWWLYADQDLTLAYQGLLYNAGLPQEYFDHPGYLSYLALGNWYRLLHALGFLRYHALADMPPPADAAAAWQALVRAGRVLSLLTAVGFTAAFALLMRRLVGSDRVALLAATAFAFSGGVILHARIMRTELLAGGLVVTGLLLFLLAARSQATRWRPALLGFGVLCCALALENKVQALLPVLAIPVLVAALGERPTPAPSPWAGARWAWPVSIGLALAAAALALPAAAVLARGFEATPVVAYPELPIGGWYQPLLALWFVAALLGFIALRRMSTAEALATFACAVAGVSIALLALGIRASDPNVVALARPVEHLAAFVAWKYAEPALSQSLIAAVPAGLQDVLVMHTFGLRLSRPTVILEWLLVAVGIVSWRRGDRRLAGGIALVLGTVIALESVFALRGLKTEYFIFTEPLVIIATAVAVTRGPVASLRPAPLVFAGVLAVMVVWSVLGSARLLFHHREPRHGVNPDDVCQWAPFYLTRIERLPFCPVQPCWEAGPFRTCWQGDAWVMSSGPPT